MKSRLRVPLTPLLAVLLAVVLPASVTGQQCYEPLDSDPYLFFSHKTAYQLIYNSKFKPVPYCRPTFVWMFIRHGTSYPTANESSAIRQLHLFKDRVINNHEERRDGHLCKSVQDSLKRWEFEVNPMSEDDISPQGKMDMRLMAKRTRDKLSEVLAREFDRNTFKFYSSEDRKVMNSAEEFSRGMFGDDFKSKISIETVHNNSSFIGLESCPKWQTPTNDVHPEALRFRSSPEYVKMVGQISARLGFLDNITDSIVHAMYESCRYNKALVLNSFPAWCGLFTRQELQLLEYYEDLDFYYKYGYGSDFNVKVGCPIAHELLGYLNDAAKEQKDSPSAVFRFGSSAGLLTTLIALDMAKDSVPLTHANYHSQYRRQWRMSQVDPFSGNLAAVFYKCDQGDEENKVMFYLNEGVYDYPGCNVGLCSWKFIQEKFKKYLGPNECGQVCHDHSLASAVGNAFVLMVTLLTAHIFVRS
ncbi:multiple inositol polyphosphate phosphatase 1-like [Adelges cooleyi]|uniref:multiple inositol polyphosphate phosphatase 1-like n=1 Tax=Adelges cooleyi TaxID=133065 RepID=UPI002180170C|nr:multiple inositol polyphosphate phosphatase 1-like [Adelges cooleyi]XP_050431285.1 multiple inositol polyphosphate phosphatase 1-like [Adelges cooleyi]